MSQSPSGERTGYDMHQYSPPGTYASDSSPYATNNLPSSKLPQQHQLIHANSHSSRYDQNQISENSYSGHQIPVSSLNITHEADAAVNSQIAPRNIPTNTNPTGLSNQITVEKGGTHLTKGNHVTSGDPGISEHLSDSNNSSSSVTSFTGKSGRTLATASNIISPGGPVMNTSVVHAAHSECHGDSNKMSSNLYPDHNLEEGGEKDVMTGGKLPNHRVSPQKSGGTGIDPQRIKGLGNHSITWARKIYIVSQHML